jgi:toxin CptA
MSIAVSALVRPSRIQRFVWGGCGLALLASALAIGLAAPGHVRLAPLVAAALAAAGGAVLRAAVLHPKTHQIDISGTGDLRVTVQQGVGDDLAGDARQGVRAVLLPGSVVWPMLMVLRYAAPGTGPRVLYVWRDSVEAAVWRALAVALAVVGRRGHADEGCEDTTNSLQRTNS